MGDVNQSRVQAAGNGGLVKPVLDSSNEDQVGRATKISRRA
jgi:hypothetical protein